MNEENLKIFIAMTNDNPKRFRFISLIFNLYPQHLLPRFGYRTFIFLMLEERKKLVLLLFGHYPFGMDWK